MITKMRKMDVLLYHKEQGKFLEELRNLGVVHITSAEQADSAAAQELRAEVQRAQRIIATLKKVQKAKNIPASAMPGNVAEQLTAYEMYEAKRDWADQEIASLNREKDALAAWGEFDPRNIRLLADAGVNIRFYTASPKKFKLLDRAKLGIQFISDRDGIVRFVTVSRGEAPEEIAGAEKVRPPDTSVMALNGKIEEIKRLRVMATSETDKMAGRIAAIEQYRDEQLDRLKYEEARLAMAGAAEGRVFRLSGWVPQKKEADLKSFLNGYHAYVTFRDPDENENVPVEIRNDRYSRLFEPITGMYSLPGYREVDVVPFIAPFFMIFCGLCLADTGYGLIVAIVAFAAMFKLSARMKPIAMLACLLGLTTATVGVLQNSMFGLDMFELLGAKGLEEKFSPLRSGVGGSEYPTISLSFVAAFLQLYLGLGLQAYIRMRDRGIFAGLQPVSSIFMSAGLVFLGAKTNFLNLGINTFAVSTIEIGPTLVAMANAKLLFGLGIGELLLYCGLALLLFFNNWEPGFNKAALLRPLRGLWELYGFASGFLSNLLSYMRLFALGLAGGLLGGAVNNIAFMISDVTKGGGGVLAAVGFVGMVIILLVGHTGNLGLSGLGAFIHPLRLTFVEFYGAVGFNGGGKPYMPFAKVKK